MSKLAGYRLVVVTDSDGIETTQTINNLTEQDIKFCVKIIKKFSYRYADGNLGNKQVLYSQIVNIISESITSESPSKSFAHAFSNRIFNNIDTDYVYRWLCDTLLGHPASHVNKNYENYCNEVIKFSVFYIPKSGI